MSFWKYLREFILFKWICSLFHDDDASHGGLDNDTPFPDYDDSDNDIIDTDDEIDDLIDDDLDLM